MLAAMAVLLAMVLVCWRSPARYDGATQPPMTYRARRIMWWMAGRSRQDVGGFDRWCCGRRRLWA
jgi:hypothetical protein